MLVIIGSCSVEKTVPKKLRPVFCICVFSSFAWTLWLSLCLSFFVCVVRRVCCAGLGWLITKRTAGWLHTQRAPVLTKTITKPAWPPLQGSLVSTWLCCEKKMTAVKFVDTERKIQNVTVFFFSTFHTHNEIKKNTPKARDSVTAVQAAFIMRTRQRS